MRFRNFNYSLLIGMITVIRFSFGRVTSGDIVIVILSCFLLEYYGSDIFVVWNTHTYKSLCNMFDIAIKID